MSISYLVCTIRAVVRKKAVMVLLRFYMLAPTSVNNLAEKVRRSLCDPDPSVMGATLSLLECLVEVLHISCLELNETSYLPFDEQKDPRVWKDVVPTLVSILKQIVQRRLPKHYEYHHVPAPWTQIKILHLLSLLGKDDKRYAVLSTKRAVQARRL